MKLTDANRGGILGMPGILATPSFPNRTSPVKRGVWVLEQVLGEHVPPLAPPNVPTLEKQDQKKTVANLTLRQRTELHRTNAVCANCHKILDPIGFGLENFDAIGRWRDQDDTGRRDRRRGRAARRANAFSSPAELKAIIAARKDDLARNLTQKLLAYALCRQLEGYDEIVVDRSLMENHRRRWLPHADAHHRDRHQLSLHESPHPITPSNPLPCQPSSPPSISEHRSPHLPERPRRPPSRCRCSKPWAGPRRGSKGAAETVKPPVRLGFMYMPHGVIMDQFWPATPESFLSSPPPALESLRPVLDQCLLMKGISGVPISPFNGAPHALELSTWLTARLPDADTRNQINIAISADQIAANYVGGLTSLPSLELATMPQTHKENQEGLNEGYYSHCSYRSPTQAVPAETNPRNVLNRLFGKTDQPGQNDQADPLDRQMLDLVLGGAKDLRAIAAGRPAQARRIPRQRALRGTPHRRHRISPERGRSGEIRCQPPANATPPTLRPSRSRSRRATSAANTCR